MARIVIPGGSASAPDLSAYAQKTDLTPLLGVTVTPSGDTTGTTDINAINAALLQGDVTLRGTYYTLGAIKMPSNRTLTLFNAEVRRVNDIGGGATTTNANIVTNLNMDSTGNTNIAIRGIGKASFRLHSSTAGYKRTDQLATPTGSVNVYFGFFFVNVTGLVVQDVSIGPTAAFTSNIQVCKDVRFRNVTCAQDRLQENQDGLDIGPGCSNVVFDGIYGTTSDDAFSLYAQNTSGSLHSYTKTLTAAQRNITDITIQNVIMDVGINVFRMQAGDGSTLSRLTFSNIVNTRQTALGVNGDKSAVLKFGRIGYVTAAPALDGSQFTNISLVGYRGPGTHLIGADSNFRDVRVSQVSMKDAETLIGWEEKNNRDASIFQPTYSRIKISDVKLTGTAATEPTLMGMTAGTASDITISSVTAETLKYVTRNTIKTGGYTHTVTDLTLTDIKAGQVTGATFGSTIQETGSAGNISLISTGSSYSGTYRAVAVKLALRGTPVGRTGDIVPAPTAGSTLLCAAGLNPVGDAYSGAGQYIADGVAWNRAYSLANDIPVPAGYTAPVAGAKVDATDGFTTTAASGIPNWVGQFTATEEGLVDANGAGISRATGSAVTRWYAAPTVPTTVDQWGQVTIGALGTATAILAPQVSVRGVMTNNNGTLLYTNYFARYTSGTGVVIYKIVDGTSTTLTTYATTLAAGGTLRLRARGTTSTTLDLSFDGGTTWVGSVVDSTSPITQIGNVWLGFRWNAAGDNAQRVRTMKWGDV